MIVHQSTLLKITCFLLTMMGLSRSDVNLESNRATLASAIGYPVDIITFNDTAGRQSARILWVKPKSVKEIQLLVREAQNLKLKVRVVGAAHTFSPLFPDPSQIGVNLDDLSGEKYHLNEKKDLLTVLSSESLADVLKWAAGKGVTLGPVPHVSIMTLTGIIATGSHGTSNRFGSLANMVHGYELIDGSGNIRKFNEDDDKEILDACRVHLGMCGIIFKTILKVIPNLKQKFTVANIPIEKLLNNDNRRDLVLNNWGAQLNFHFDFKSATDDELKIMYTDPARRIPETYNIFQEDMQLWLWTDVDQNTELSEEFNDRVTLADGSTYDAISVIKPYSETSTGLLVHSKGQCYQLRTAMSFATPESDDFTESNKTLTNHLTVLEGIFKNLGFYPQFGGSTIRWMKHFDDCLLCSTKVADDSSKYRLVTFTETCSHYDKCAEPMITDEHLAKQKLIEFQFGVGSMANNSRILPHWAKHFPDVPGTTDQIRRQFGDDLVTFINVRNKYSLDTNNVFVNDYLEDIFRDTFVLRSFSLFGP